MKKSFVFLLIGLLFSLAVMAQSTGALFDLERYLNTPLVDFDEILGRNRVQRSPAPGACFLNHPPAGHQGSQGSCTAWAVGYAAVSTLAGEKYGYDWEQARMSPSFIFNSLKIYNDCDMGIYVIDALDFVRSNGVCPLSVMPYDDSDCTTKPTALQRQLATYNTVSYGRITNTDVNMIKQAVHGGFPVVINFYANASFGATWYDDGIWDYDSGDRDPNKGHVCCIVGYDDTRQMFKVLNSWGNGGDNGCFWVTYNLVRKGIVREAYMVYNINPSINLSISGASTLCDEAGCSISGLPSGARVEWKVRCRMAKIVGTNDWVYITPFIIESGQGTSTVTLSRGNYRILSTNEQKDLVGEEVLTAVVRYNGDSIVLRKTIEIVPVEPPVICVVTKLLHWVTNSAAPLAVVSNDNTIKELTNDGDYVFGCSNFQDHEDMEWSITASNGSWHGTGKHSPTVDPDVGLMVVTVRHVNACPDGAVATQTYRVVSRAALQVSDNPATGTVNVCVQYEVPVETVLHRSFLNSDNATLSSVLASAPTEFRPYSGTYTIELWDLFRGKLRTVTGEGGFTQFPLDGVAPGNYILRLLIDGAQVDSKPLMVR